MRRPTRTPDQWLDDFVTELEARNGDGRRNGDSRHGDSRHDGRLGSASIAAQRLSNITQRRDAALPLADRDAGRSHERGRGQTPILDAVAALLRETQDNTGHRPPPLGARLHVSERLAELAASIRARKDAEHNAATTAAAVSAVEDARRQSRRDSEAAERAEHIMEALRMDVSAIADRLEGLKPRDHASELATIEASLDRLAGRDEIAALEQSIIALAEQLEQLAGANPAGAHELELTAIRDRLEHLADLVMRHRDSIADSEATTLAFGKRLDLISHKLDILTKSHTLDIANQLDIVAERLDELAALPSRAEDGRLAIDQLSRKLDRLAPAQAEAADHIAAKLDQLAARVHNQTQLNTTVLEGQIQALAEHIDAAQRDETIAADLGLAIDELSRKLDHVLPGQAHLASGIAERIDQLAAAIRVQKVEGLGGLERQLGTLSQSVEAARRDSADAAELGKAIEGLTRKIDQALPPQAALVTLIAERLDRLGMLVKSQNLKNSVALEQQIRALADKIDATGRGDINAAELSRAIAGLAGKIDTALEATANQSAQRLAGGINGRLDELATLVKAAGQGPHNDHVEKAIRALSDRIDAAHLGAGGNSDLTPIMESLFRKIDEAVTKPAQISGSLHQRLDDLAAMLARHHQGQRQNAGAVEERIRLLADQIGAIKTSHLNAGALTALERQIADLAARIEETGAHNASHLSAGALTALERQIAALAARIEEMRAGSGLGDDIAGTLKALERTIGGLSGHFTALRDDATRMAERAARRAVSETLAALPQAKPASDASEPRERGSFEAMQDTLKHAADQLGPTEAHDAAAAPPPRVAAKLGANLGAMSAAKDEARPATAGEALARAAARMAAAKAAAAGAAAAGAAAAGRTPPPIPRLKPQITPKITPKTTPSSADEERDTVPAGLGPFDAPARPAVLKPLPSQASVDRNDVKANFIAAARRAAQAAQGAAGEASPPIIPARERLEMVAQEAEAKRPPLKRRSGPVRRNVALMAAAALVVAVGAARLMGDFSTLPLLGDGASAPRDVAIDLGGQQKTDDKSADKSDQKADKTAARRDVPANPFSDTPDQTGSLTTRSVSRFTASDAAADPKGTQVALGGKAEAATSRIERVETIAGLKEMQTAPELSGLRQAALAGDPNAVYELGARIADGRGLTRDVGLAARLLERAAEHGSAPAQYRLAGLYEKGMGVTRDPAQARKWYERAAEQGNAKAMHNLAVLLAEGSNGKPDYAVAVEWFRRGAEHGIRDSQYNLAILLARGLGTGQNLPQSYMWFAIAAGQGDEDAGKKRDEVASRLSATDLKGAKAMVDEWKPKPLNSTVNEVSLPVGTFDAVSALPIKPTVPAPKDKAAKGQKI